MARDPDVGRSPTVHRRYQPEAIELHLFIPGTDGTHHSSLQEDDGTSFAANSGARFRTTFDVTRVGQRITVRAEVDGDGYPAFARRQFDLIAHGAVADTVVVDGTQRDLDGGRIELSNDGTSFEIELTAN